MHFIAETELGLWVNNFGKFICL